MKEKSTHAGNGTTRQLQRVVSFYTKNYGGKMGAKIITKVTNRVKKYCSSGPVSYGQVGPKVEIKARRISPRRKMAVMLMMAGPGCMG
jgi:hypothetical protein